MQHYIKIYYSKFV